MTSLNTFRSQLDFYLRDPNAKIWPYSYRDIAINMAYSQMQADLNYWSNENLWTTTYTTTAGVYEYTLPSDFARIKQVRYNFNGQNKYPLARTTLKKLQAQYTKFVQGQPYWYYKNGLTLGVYPIPQSEGLIYLNYYTMLPEITEAQDSETPQEYDDSIILYAAYKLLTGTEKDVKAQQCKRQYDDNINKLRLMYEYDDENMRFLNERTTQGIGVRSDVITDWYYNSGRGGGW